jgi:multiple sugar transport system permease protein
MATQSARQSSVAVLERSGSSRRIVIGVVQATLWYVGLALIGSIFLLPFFWMLTTSVKTPIQVFKYPIQWIPDPIVLRNYIDAWTVLPFTTFLRNTLIITITAMIGETLTSSLVAFSFARIPFRGRNVLFVVLLATMMLPPQVTLIPRFIIFAKLNLIDTFVPLILPAFFAHPFYTFLLRQFFLTIPDELEDAAFVDGASRFRLWWNIFLPLSKPALATVLIFAFIAHWNEFFDALIYLNSQRNKTLALGLSQLREAHSTEWHWMMAIAVIMVLPCIALFFTFQRYFVEGITMTGTKG